MKLSTKPVTAPTKIIKSEWSVDLADDLAAVTGLSLEDILVDQMTRSEYGRGIEELFNEEEEDYGEL